ncbi:SNF2 family N-terminal domain-containing protein [Trichophaea hybrida]|nr:SNF2 family N-terminal domain-containing protein [Trichophaea hybrida]
MKTVYILVYGFRKDLEEIGDFLSQNELFLQHPSFFDPAVHYDNPHYLLSPGKEIEIPDQAHLGSQGQAGERKSTSNVVNEISDIFETAGGPTHYSEVRVSAHLKTELKCHQKKALAMMIEKESGKIEDNEFGSLWEVIRETGQGTRYRNVVTGKTSKDKPVVCHGGLLADAMGLGKSLTTLALIVGSIDYPSSVGQVSANRPTLIVAPKSTLSGWQEQIDRHLYPDSLRVYTYHGSQREKDTSKLSSYDIVLTTYGTLSAESAKDKRGSTQTAALHSIEWFRIVLDEAHFIRDKSTKQSQAACTLNSRYRWCLTGTPVQNRIDDFAALLRFLRVKPFDKPATFNSCIVNLLRRGDLSGVRKLRLLVNAVSLRRTKGLLTSEIQLPLREDRVEQIDFTDEERQLYQLIRDQSDSMLNAYEKEKSTKYCCTVLQIILRLRQICNHGPDLLPEKFKTSLEKCQASGELAMVSGDECEACGKEIKPEASVEVLVPSCLHILCAKCKGGGKAVKASSSGGNDASHCPLCFPAESDVPDKQTTTPLRQRTKVTKEYKPSSKVQALIANLRRDREEYYNVKSVIFTGWTQMLDLVEQALDAEGIGFQRLDGSTTLQQRNKRIGSFRNDDDCTVLLATIGTAGVGLDLTAASRVHLLEPQWNPLIEEQALDRIHRMGQTKNVVTYRYIVKDSIDEVPNLIRTT